MASKVVGRISFVEPDGTVAIDKMLGRWAESPQRAETGRLGISLDEVQLDIEPNGLPHPLDIAMKRVQDSSIYVVNDDNSAAPEFCLSKHELNRDEYTVRVSLRGSNTDEIVADFTLRNGGTGKSITLSPLQTQEVIND
jgi:hypothetical protein